MKYLNLALLALILLYVKVDAIDRESVIIMFDKGNEAFQEENYELAISEYEKILQNGYESGELYFNLGNAYYKVGQIGNSILNYERSKIWIPRNRDLSFNLKLANLKVKDRIDAPAQFFLFRFYNRLVNTFSTKGWALWVTFSFLISALCFALIMNLEMRRFRILPKITLILSILVLVLTIFPLVQRYMHENSQDRGVIITYSVRSLSAPQEGSTELFVIHEGIQVKIVDIDDDWYNIELIDGKQGWVPMTTVEII